jgi:hypothetical protein
VALSKTVSVSIPHRLTPDEARVRIQRGIGDLRTQFAGKVASLEERWTANHADFQAKVMGQTITARLDIEEHAVRVEVDLPWLFAALAGKITPVIEREGAKLLERR